MVGRYPQGTILGERYTKMTIAQTLTRGTPLTFNRPASASPSVPQGPTDGVTLSPPKEPDLREPERGGRMAGMAVGALALVGLGVVIGAVGGAQVVQQGEIQTERQTETTVDRNGEPITQEQWANMKQIGVVKPEDNASAREVKEGYLSVAQELLTEADYFRAQGQTLEQEGQRLEYLGKELGNGTHQVNGAEVTVELRENGITVTLREGDTTKSLRRDGDTLTVEVDGVSLEDTSSQRSVTEGQTTRTLYLQDSILHHAGEFEVTTASRSVQQTTRVFGTDIHRKTDQMVSGYAGRETISETQSWTKPEVAITLYPGTVLKFESSRTSHNLTLDGDANESYRNVEVRQDGSTKVRHNYTLDSTDVDVIEPAQSTAPPTTIIQ